MSAADLPVDLVHVFVFASPHAWGAMAASEDALAASGAELVLLRTQRLHGGTLETTLKVRGVAEPAARSVAARLERRPDVDSLRLEHRWGLS